MKLSALSRLILSTLALGALSACEAETPQELTGEVRQCTEHSVCGVEGALCWTDGTDYACECPSGYAATGVNSACKPESTEPPRNLCSNPSSTCGVVGATCTPEGNSSFVCECPEGYGGGGLNTKCHDIDNCADGNEAVCGHSDATCRDMTGSFQCVCPPDWTNDGPSTPCEPTACASCDAYCTPQKECVSSIANEDSPYWHHACPNSNELNNPTNFELDCRCINLIDRPNDPSHPHYTAYLRCKQVTDGGDYAIGTGPSVRKLLQRDGGDSGQTGITNGFLDAETRTIYHGVEWGTSTRRTKGAVFTVNADFNSPELGNRTILSGHWNDQDGYNTIGSGPELPSVQDVQQGPDGMLYALSWQAGVPVTITRIDPATGNRTFIWKEEAYTGAQKDEMPAHQCSNGHRTDGTNASSRYSLQIPHTGTRMAIGPDGEFYFSVTQAPRTYAQDTGPQGIIKISPDGQSCEWVTRFNAGPDNDYAEKAEGEQGSDYGAPRGTGPRGRGPDNYFGSFANLFYKESSDGRFLYMIESASNSNMSYIRVNIDTGDRRTLFQGVLGDTNSVWDPMREVLWTSGGYDATIIAAADIYGQNGGEPNALGGLKCLSTNSTWYRCMRGPGEADRQNRRGLFYDPIDGNLMFGHGVYGLVRVEVATGNTYVFSR